MSTQYRIPVTAAQVGTSFVGQYYHVLQQQPQYVHQFYSDASTMLRIDGTNRATAATMLQIHSLIMSLNYTGIKVRTANALESWNGGVLVMVSGSVLVKDFNSRRKFVETFFLAPQEKSYFVLNDVFHFIEEESIQNHPAVLLAQTNVDSKLNATNTIPEPVSNYLLGGEIQTREFVASADVKENGSVENYSFPEQRVQPVLESENIQDENSVEELDGNGSLQNAVNTMQDHLPVTVDETAGEPQKHTYASIVAKRQSAPSVVPQPSVNKNAPPVSEWNHTSLPIAQQSTMMSNSFEGSVADTVEVSALEDEHQFLPTHEIRSVYVRNLLPNVSEAEIEEEFKNFGKIAPDGVVIRSQKDVSVCYAFVEFKDMTSVHTAVKAGSAIVAGRQVYIEERRPNSNIPSRAGRGRGGRGRSSYQTDAPRGLFSSRSFGRGSGYDEGDRDYNRPRGNGYYRPNPRQERGISGHQVRSGQHQSEQTA